MADVNSAPQSGPVLSYTVTNERGWNDPPTFAFSPNSTGNRKRIDPRKRVSHNITSMSNGYNTGSPTQTFQPAAQPPQHFQPSQPAPTAQPPQHFQPSQPAPIAQPFQPNQPTAPAKQPVTQPFQPIQPMNGANQYPGNVYTPQMNGLANGFNSMSLTPAQGPLNHASSNPDIHQMPPVQPSQMHSSFSVPAHMNKTGTPGHAFGCMTPPPSSCSTPPLVQPRSGSATPPHIYMHNQSSNSRKMSAPSIPFANPSIFSQHSTPTMLQASHLKPTADNAPVSTPVNNGLAITTQPTSLPPRISPMPPMMGEHLTNNTYNRSHSNPEALRRPSPTNNIPPPTMGYYTHKATSGGNSPVSASPGHSGKSSPTPPFDATLLDNDNIALSNTLNFLNNFKTKCSCNLSAKMSDDIGKKIQVFSKAWSTGLLSKNTKIKMVQLGQALNETNIQAAEKLHLSLIREHSNEVKSWVIVIKKLITTYQSLPSQ